MAAMFVCALAAPSARANVLVYEGFHPDDYNNVGDNTQMTPSSANVTGERTVGLATGAWQMSGAQPKVYGQNFGLALPVAMTDAGFSVLGGSIGLNPGENNKALRSTSHGLVDGALNISSGTLYVRVLLNLDSKAATKLVAGNSLTQKDGGYFGFGLTTGTTDFYLLTKSAASLAFVIWKNSSNQYVLSLAHTTASETAFTSYPLVTGITLGTTYLCYAEIDVGAGTDGKEILRAGAMATDAFTTDTPWAVLDGESDSVEVELMTASNYPTRIAVAGPYGTKDGSNGYFRADEFVVGTEISDILLAVSTKPKLTDGALSLANGTYTVSASLGNSAADVSYILFDGTTSTTNAIAAYSDGDTVSGTFAAPSDNKTYEVLLLAKNAGDETGELSLGTIYGGMLSLAKVSDAAEFGATPATLTVSRVSNDPLPLVVNYAFADGTAVAGVNYVDDAGYVTIPAGETSATIRVTPLIDVATESDTTMSVSLAAGNYTAPAAVAVSIANFTTPAGQNYWVGGTATDGAFLASTPANWSAGHAPLESENVVFDGGFSTVDCTWDAAATATVASWTQTNGYSGTVTVDTVFPDKGAFTVLTVAGDMAISSGSVTHREHTATYKVDQYRLRINVGGDLTVASGAKITARAKGSCDYRVGAAAAYGGSYDGVPAWGSLTEPYEVGSSANDYGVYTCRAGGAIWIEVTGATTLDGTIDANGIMANDKFGNTAAGSGGAVYLKTATLSGSGKVSANCENEKRGSNSWTAAGGRVSILLTDGELDSFPDANVTAWAGNSSYSHVGGVGTVLVRTPQKPNGVLYLRDRSGKYSQYGYRPKPTQLTCIPAGQTWVVDAIVFGDNAILEVPAGTTLDLRGGLASVSSTGNTLDETGLIVDGGTLLLPNAATHTISGKWIFEPTDFALDGNLTVTGGAGVGTLLLYSDTTNNVRTCGLAVTGNMTVDSGAYLRAVRGGFIATNALASVASSHGGARRADSIANRSYDSFFHPRHPGAFGIDNGLVNVGGGAIRLAVGGTLTLNGVATATPVVNNDRSGAGGSIDITAARLEGSGRIEANGNSRNYTAENSSAAGGGGRIAVRLTGARETFSDYWIANINAKGFYSSKITAIFASSAGSVYLQTAAQGEGAGTIIVRNTGDTDNNLAVTSMPSVKGGGEDDDFRKATLRLEAAARVQFHADLRLAGLEMASGTVVDLNGKAIAVKSAVVGGVKLAPGTYAAGDLGDCVADSLSGGTLTVSGGGFKVLVR